MTDRLKERLLAAIEHGDADHRAWLKEAIWAFFDDRPVPPSRGSGAKEARITQLEAEVERLAHHWQVLSDILDDTHIENDEPARVKWNEEWHYGPAAEAMNAMMRSLKKLCRAALHQGDRKP